MIGKYDSQGREIGKAEEALSYFFNELGLNNKFKNSEIEFDFIKSTDTYGKKGIRLSYNFNADEGITFLKKAKYGVEFKDNWTIWDDELRAYLFELYKSSKGRKELESELKINEGKKEKRIKL